MYYIGVDLGGTNIVVGLINEAGNIEKKLSTKTLSHRKTEEIFDDIIKLCKDIISDYALTKESLKGIGIGIPGEIDRKEGIINYSNNIPMKDFKVKEYLSKHLDFPLDFANDADCAALGELAVGKAKGKEDIIFLTLGTGVGGGIIINKSIYSGFYAGGAELGHQTIVYNGVECSCGNKGCLEAYASATALIRDARNVAKSDKSTLLNTLCGNNLEKIDAKMVFDAAKESDEVAIKLVNDYIEYLSVGVANLINIFKPELVLIGGGISKQGNDLIVPLTEKTKPKLFGKEMKTKIEVASLGNDAGLIGAAMLLKNLS